MRVSVVSPSSTRLFFCDSSVRCSILSDSSCEAKQINLLTHVRIKPTVVIDIQRMRYYIVNTYLNTVYSIHVLIWNLAYTFYTIYTIHALMGIQLLNFKRCFFQGWHWKVMKMIKKCRTTFCGKLVCVLHMHCPKGAKTESQRGWARGIYISLLGQKLSPQI